MTTKPLPTTLLEAVTYFSDLDVATDYVAKLRWPNGPVCPKCGSVEHSFISTRRIWKCKACKKQFSVKAGTIFEDSPLPLTKWLPAIWLAANAKNGISSHELARALGITQKSAWFMLQRIRLGMQTGSFAKFEGIVEVDETYIGGLARNMHHWKRQAKQRGGRSIGKTPVVGIMQRGGQVRARVVQDVRRHTVRPIIDANVARGARVYTDKFPTYFDLGADYNHAVIDHMVKYVDGQVHTNYIENFWSLLKRGLKGTYISVQPFHLFRYLDERVFTFNMRHLDDYGRFSTVLGQVTGRRLTYAELIGHA